MRVRFTFTKTGPLRYIGHLDLHKIWERATRRSELPLAYSQGFHPHPKIQLASALPLGFSSVAEVVDIWLNSEQELSEIRQQAQGSLPPGLQIVKVEEVAENAPALQSLMHTAEYEITLRDFISHESLTEKLEALLVVETLPRVRRRKDYDLRPLIDRIDILLPNTKGENRLFMRLSAR